MQIEQVAQHSVVGVFLNCDGAQVVMRLAQGMLMHVRIAAPSEARWWNESSMSTVQSTACAFRITEVMNRFHSIRQQHGFGTAQVCQ